MAIAALARKGLAARLSTRVALIVVDTEVRMIFSWGFSEIGYRE
jgi:hypothetical protein